MSLQVLIDNQKEKYLPGQSLVGRVHCSITEPQRVEVTVKLIGEEFTQYTGDSTTTRIPIRSRGWKCTFLETKDVVIRAEDLNVGDYDFPFNVTLPRRIPSSYVGKYGYVKFILRARSGKVEVAETEFKVFSPIDLNTHVNLWLAPSTHSDELLMKKWWCVPQSVRMRVSLEQEVFTVGDVLNVGVVVTNNSSLIVSTVKVRLVAKIQAKVATPRQEFLSVYELLASDQDYGIGSYNEKKISFQLKIPLTAELANFEKCSLFSQTAFLEVIGVMRESKPDLKVEVGLVLGHIPVDGQGMFSLFKSIPVKARLPDPAIIRPLTYGLYADSIPFKPLALAPQPSERKTTSAKHTDTSSSHVLVPTKPNQSPQTQSTDEIPIPVLLYESKTLPTNKSDTETNSLYPNPTPAHLSNTSGQNIPPYPVPLDSQVVPPTPYPPYPKEYTKGLGTLTDSPIPFRMSYLKSIQKTETTPPYPVGKSERGVGNLAETMPMPSNSSNALLERVCPYPVKSSTPPYLLKSVVPPYPALECDVTRGSSLTGVPLEPPSVSMPIPNNFVPCDSIGFAVPTNSCVKSSQLEPSAPPQLGAELNHDDDAVVKERKRIELDAPLPKDAFTFSFKEKEKSAKPQEGLPS